MTSPETAPTPGSLRGDVVIGALSIAVGAGVIPYGASMPYIREGIPGPGLFPMMIGGLLLLFGALLILTRVLGVRRDRRNAARLAAIGAPGGPAETPAGTAPLSAPAVDPAARAAGAPGTGDAEDAVTTTAVLDTDIGSDGPRRWVNGAVLLGGIVFFVLAAEPLGFPLTMAIVVIAIVLSLRGRWWVALVTGVLTSTGLWAMFELGLLVQLPDGIIQGF